MTNRKILILPGLLDPTGGQSLVHPRRPLLDGIEAETKGERIEPIALTSGQLVSTVGLNPDRYPLAPGPLAIAALGLEPPVRSSLFCLSVVGLDSNGNIAMPEPPTASEARWLNEELPRLSARQLTVCLGDGVDHGLVWEPGSIDLRTYTPTDIIGKSYGVQLPEGDGEPMLRRFIDDSLNLLMNSEVNERRMGEGKTPLSIAWPWGQGLRISLPNLGFQLGEPLTLTSSMHSIRGLANLSRSSFRPLPAPFRGEWEFRSLPGTQILVTDVFQSARMAGRLERAEELWEIVRAKVISPYISESTPDRRQLSLICPNDSGYGLAIHWDSHVRHGDGVPLHERALLDDALSKRHLWEIVRSALQLP